MPETQHIEFKPNFNEDVIETLVAFANAKGGRVLVGVDDKSGKPVKKFRRIKLRKLLELRKTVFFGISKNSKPTV